MIAVREYIKPLSIDEALNRLGGGYIPIAGGTDLIVQLRDGRPRKILDLGGLNLDFIHETRESVEIGALATHAAIASSSIILESLPALARASGLVGSQQIRNRGTVGGNIVNASPCADTVPALLLYDAEIILISTGGKITVPLSRFVLGPYETALSAGEILHSIVCKKDKTRAGWSYIKLGRRRAVNISRMTLAATISLTIDGRIGSARLSAGSVFPAPSRMAPIEGMLHGQTPSPELFSSAARAAADLMIAESGRRWSTAYKEPVLIALLSRVLEEASIRTDIEAES